LNKNKQQQKQENTIGKERYRVFTRLTCGGHSPEMAAAT